MQIASPCLRAVATRLTIKALSVRISGSFRAMGDVAAAQGTFRTVGTSQTLKSTFASMRRAWSWLGGLRGKWAIVMKSFTRRGCLDQSMIRT